MLASRPLLLLLAALGFAACATPRDRCLAAATGELRTLERLAAETRTNIRRGYGVEEYQDVREVRRRCRVETVEGTRSIPCNQTVVRDRTRPVTLDIAAERQKLTQLDRRIAAQRAASAQAQQACLAAYPA